jgi:hypothetical protein
MYHRSFRLLTIAFSLVILIGASVALAAPDASPLLAPIGTAFTYQGYIEAAGAPANGSYDMRFSLYNDPSAGILVAGPVTKPSVSVADGLFTVTLDFGDVFDGTAYWLLIEVQGPADPGYTALSPRQPLTPVPYAVNADFVDGYGAVTVTEYLAIPAAAFGATQFDAEWDNGGDRLLAYEYGMGSTFRAPVFLPQGAVVTGVTFYYNDTDPAAYNADPILSGDARVTLFRVTLSSNSRSPMAEVDSSGSSGLGSASDTTIVFPDIDNLTYSYYIRAQMPMASMPFTEIVELNSIVIEYSIVGLE